MSKVYNLIIEGADGVGKSTLAKNLAKEFNSRGWIAIQIGEPNCLIKGLRDIAKKTDVVLPDLNNFSALADMQYQNLYQQAPPCSEAAISLMIAAMAQAADFLKKITALLADRDKKILVIKDRSIISTFVYQALVPTKLYLIQDIWNAYSSLVKEDWNVGCLLLDSDEASTNTRHQKDCHYDSNTKHILSCYRLIPAIFGMTKDQYQRFIREEGKPKEISNRLYETLNERSRLGLLSRVPKYYVLNTAKLDENQTTKTALGKIDEWVN